MTAITPGAGEEAEQVPNKPTMKTGVSDPFTRPGDALQNFAAGITKSCQKTEKKRLIYAFAIGSTIALKSAKGSQAFCLERQALLSQSINGQALDEDK